MQVWGAKIALDSRHHVEAPPSPVLSLRVGEHVLRKLQTGKLCMIPVQTLPYKYIPEYDVGLDELTLHVNDRDGALLGTASLPLALLVKGLQHELSVEIPRIGTITVSMLAADFGIPLTHSPARVGEEGAHGSTIVTVHVPLTNPDSCRLFGMPEIIVTAVELEQASMAAQHGQALRNRRKIRAKPVRPDGSVDETEVKIIPTPKSETKRQVVTGCGLHILQDQSLKIHQEVILGFAAS